MMTMIMTIYMFQLMATRSVAETDGNGVDSFVVGDFNYDDGIFVGGIN